MPTVTGEIKNLGGVRYVDIVEGTGQILTARRCAYTHYTGWLSTGTKFDSSRDIPPSGAPVEPIGFPLGAKRVIDGWDLGFQGMRAGGKRRLYVPYRLGYGERGSPPVIPERADLIFDVELMAIADALPSRSTTPQCPAWRAVAS